MENDKIILLSCWAKPLKSGAWNAKNPNKSWWEKLCLLLKNEQYKIYQLGQGPEIRLKGVDKFIWDTDIWEITEKYFPIVITMITIDNMWNHMCWYKNKKAIVIFSRSDPEIFGHPENINLLKDRKNLRENQFEPWEYRAEYNSNSFICPEEVMAALKNNF